MKSRALISVILIALTIAILTAVVGALLAATPTVQHTRLTTDKPIKALAISPDNQLLAIGVQIDRLNPGTIAQVWYMKKLDQLPVELRGSSSSTSLAFSPDNRLLAIGHQDATITIWNRADLSSSPTKPYTALSTHSTDMLGVSALSFTPDSRKLFSAGPGPSIHIWDVERMTLLSSLPADGGTIFSLAIDAKGTLVASGDNDGTVTVWDLLRPTQKPAQLKGQEGVLSVAFSPDGSLLASGGLGGTVFVRNSKALAAQPIILDTHPGEQRKYLTDFAVHSVQFSPDGIYLAAGSNDQTVHIWDVRNTKAQPVIMGMHAGGVSSIAYSNDSRVLIAVSSPFIYLWQVGSFFYDTVKSRP